MRSQTGLNNTAGIIGKAHELASAVYDVNARRRTRDGYFHSAEKCAGFLARGAIAQRNRITLDTRIVRKRCLWRADERERGIKGAARGNLRVAYRTDGRSNIGYEDHQRGARGVRRPRHADRRSRTTS